MTDSGSPPASPRRPPPAAKETVPVRKLAAVPTPDPDSPATDSDGYLLDPRYADVVTGMREWCGIVLEAMIRAEVPDMDKTFDTEWARLIEPRLVSVLAAFAGPVTQPVESCSAYYYAKPDDDEEGWNVCSGPVDLAVVERDGQPESPGDILRHLPGCEKHARRASAELNARHHRYRLDYPALPGVRWYQVDTLTTARLEIRLQELDAARARRTRPRWWQFWK